MRSFQCRLFILIMTLILTFSTSAIAQQPERKLGIPEIIPPPKAPRESYADGSVKPFRLTRKTVKDSIMVHPQPEVYLVFPRMSSEKKKIALPVAAKNVLSDCWAAELVYYYKRDFENPTPEMNVDAKLELGRVNSWVLSKLERIQINTPTGKRKITDEEAALLVKFMSQSAHDVVQQAKESLSPPRIVYVMGREQSIEYGS